MTEDIFTTTAARFTTAADRLEATLDPQKRAEDIATKTRDFEPGQKYAYAPESERLKVVAAIEAEHETASGKALFDCDDAIYQDEPRLMAEIDKAMQPPDALRAWIAGRGIASHTGTEWLLVDLLDETRRARFDRELADALPSRVLRLYRDAIEQPNDQERATLIRYVERRHLGQWTGRGVKGDNEHEIHAERQLQQAMRDARQQRLPRSAADALAAVDRAKRVGQRARDLQKVQPVRTRPPFRSEPVQP